MSDVNSEIEFVDAHIHLDLYDDPRKTIKRIGHARICAFAMTNAPFVFEHCSRLAVDCASVDVALGFHPELCVEYEDQIALFEKLLAKTDVVGEVGLDYVTAGTKERKAQRRVFEAIVRCCSVQDGKILSVHTRKAVRDALEIMRGFQGKMILHWFTGTVGELCEARDMGAYFSINLKMLQSRRGRMLITKMPKERVLIESDTPLINYSKTMDLVELLNETSVELGKLWDTSLIDVKSTILHNFKGLKA